MLTLQRFARCHEMSCLHLNFCDHFTYIVGNQENVRLSRSKSVLNCNNKGGRSLKKSRLSYLPDVYCNNQFHSESRFSVYINVIDSTVLVGRPNPVSTEIRALRQAKYACVPLFVPLRGDLRAIRRSLCCH